MLKNVWRETLSNPNAKERSYVDQLKALVGK